MVVSTAKGKEPEMFNVIQEWCTIHGGTEVVESDTYADEAGVTVGAYTVLACECTSQHPAY